jgi:hypothetical protein
VETQTAIFIRFGETMKTQKVTFITFGEETVETQTVAFIKCSEEAVETETTNTFIRFG